MAKKKAEKATEPKEIRNNRLTNFLKSETTHFVVGLISVIFAVYLLLAFTSFFFTGAADQSILDNQEAGELMQTGNQIKNYAGARGAQVAEFLINECFGVAAYFIVLFLAVLGMRMMRAYKFRVWKWFMSCTVMMIWFSILMGFVFDGTFTNSFIYPGGLHGYNVSNWLISQIGMPGVGLLLLVIAILFCVYLSRETMQIVRKTLHPQFKRKEPTTTDIPETNEEPVNVSKATEQYEDPKPVEVDFDMPKEEVKEENKEEIEIKQRADFRKKVLSKIYESVLEFYSATFDLNTSFDNAYCIQQEKLLTETLTVLFKQFKQDHPPKFKVSEFVGTCEQLFFNACEDILPEKSDDWNKVVDAMNWLYRSAPQEYPHIHRRKYFGYVDKLLEFLSIHYLINKLNSIGKAAQPENILWDWMYTLNKSSITILN